MNTNTTDPGRELQQAQEELRLLRGLHLAVLNDASRRAQLIYGQAGTGNAPAAAELTADLMQYLSTRKHQFTMRQERQGTTPGAYDLAGLHVDAGQPSDSETGFEDQG